MTLLLTLAAMIAAQAGSPSNGLAPASITGRIEQVRFSPDARKLYLLISNRSEHAAAQLYERDLAANVDRRVTWSDGDIESFDVAPRDRFVYASTTDEIKERPHPSERPVTEGQPTEIYLADRFGLDIRRVTHHAGFDGDASFGDGGSFVAFVSRVNGHDSVLRSRDGKPPQTVSKPEARAKHWPAFSIRGKLAWLESSAPGEPALVRVEGRPHPIFPDPRPIKFLARSLDHGWLAVERGGATSKLLQIDADPACEALLWEGPQNLEGADVTATGRMALVLEEKGQTRLELKDLPSDRPACGKTPPPAKIAP